MSRRNTRLSVLTNWRFATLCLLLACQPHRTLIRDFEVTRYREVSSDYQYSANTIEYQGKRFVPTLEEQYEGGVLTSIAVFKSEGRLVYSRSDLEADSRLATALGVTQKRQLIVSDGSVVDNAKLRRVEGAEGVGKYSCLGEGALLIYVSKEQPLDGTYGSR